MNLRQSLSNALPYDFVLVGKRFRERVDNSTRRSLVERLGKRREGQCRSPAHEMILVVESLEPLLRRLPSIGWLTAEVHVARRQVVGEPKENADDDRNQSADCDAPHSRKVNGRRARSLLGPRRSRLSLVESSIALRNERFAAGLTRESDNLVLGSA